MGREAPPGGAKQTAKTGAMGVLERGEGGCGRGAPQRGGHGWGGVGGGIEWEFTWHMDGAARRRTRRRRQTSDAAAKFGGWCRTGKAYNRYNLYTKGACLSAQKASHRVLLRRMHRTHAAIHPLPLRLRTVGACIATAARVPNGLPTRVHVANFLSALSQTVNAPNRHTWISKK